MIDMDNRHSILSSQVIGKVGLGLVPNYEIQLTDKDSFFICRFNPFVISFCRPQGPLSLFSIHRWSPLCNGHGSIEIFVCLQHRHQVKCAEGSG